MFPGGNCSSRLRFYARRAASGFGGAIPDRACGRCRPCRCPWTGAILRVWPPGNLFFWGGNPACRWKNGGKGGIRPIRTPFPASWAFSARYFSGLWSAVAAAAPAACRLKRAMRTGARRASAAPPAPEEAPHPPQYDGCDHDADTPDRKVLPPHVRAT